MKKIFLLSVLLTAISVAAQAAFPDPNVWYQIKTRETNTSYSIRVGGVIGYYPTTEWNIIPQNASNATAARSAGTNPFICLADEYTESSSAEVKNAQLWRLLPNEDGTKYALINKANPHGAISRVLARDGGGANASRWIYEDDRRESPDSICWFTLAELGLDGGSSYTNMCFENPNSSASASSFLTVAIGGQNYQLMRTTDQGAGSQWTFIEKERYYAPEEGKYYRLRTRFIADATQARYGSCIELLAEGAPQLTTYAAKNAAVNRLWSSAPVNSDCSNYEYQWFRFDLDHTTGYYAMVPYAKQDGSINTTTSISINANTARWDYDATTKHYGFYFVDGFCGHDDAGLYVAFTSRDVAAGQYMNISAAGQGFSCHLWGSPNDQDAGIFTLEEAPKQVLFNEYASLISCLSGSNAFTFENNAVANLEAMIGDGIRDYDTMLEACHTVMTEAVPALHVYVTTDDTTAASPCLAHSGDDFTAAGATDVNSLWTLTYTAADGFMLSNHLHGTAEAVTIEPQAEGKFKLRKDAEYIHHLTAGADACWSVDTVTAFININKNDAVFALESDGNVTIDLSVNNSSLTAPTGYQVNGLTPSHMKLTVAPFVAQVQGSRRVVAADAAATELDVEPGTSTITIGGLQDGKYTLHIPAGFYSDGTGLTAEKDVVFEVKNPTVTSITEVGTDDNTNAAIYDLSGRRVQRAVRGLYIVNGHKVIL